ncbi:hypothetical protein [Mesorhizobium sp.]|uniref:hypothetical protein n=1 Tax=Mesorhizobium sp. TaxID=1871066 RepID=UPI0025FA475C|nr:hypothetical protein [Mesorhizobium sp.]
MAFYISKIARLGGYLNRTRDPPPGNIVMWRGLTRLTDIALGLSLAAELVVIESFTGWVQRNQLACPAFAVREVCADTITCCRLAASRRSRHTADFSAEHPRGLFRHSFYWRGI